MSERPATPELDALPVSFADLRHAETRSHWGAADPLTEAQILAGRRSLSYRYGIHAEQIAKGITGALSMFSESPEATSYAARSEALVDEMLALVGWANETR